MPQEYCLSSKPISTAGSCAMEYEHRIFCQDCALLEGTFKMHVHLKCHGILPYDHDHTVLQLFFYFHVFALKK